MIFRKIIHLIKRSNRILISTHVSPDPDAICSELIAAAYVQWLGKNVSIVNCDAVPHRLQIINGTEKIKAYNEGVQKKFDLAIIVDCGELDRIGKVQKLITKETKIINIDHHITNDFFGTANIVKPEVSSTAEVLYQILKGGRYPLNKNIAKCIYIGIMTDTGSFRYENTVALTHQVVADLMKFKFSANDLYRKFYETIPLSDLKLFTKVISQFETFENGKIVAVSLSKMIFFQFSEDFDLRDAIFKYLRAVKEVQVILVFSEVERNKTRINLRSSGKVDVARLAAVFHGGGHRRASGCMINKGLKKAKSEMIDEARKLL